MVFIKKVDIFGFKSFGFKTTTVNFEPGLVSISGPNGSGKSNILDAIIFAMGENKARVMRQPNLRSLIHDIDGSRHGPKLTRVKVQFDNSDRKIPVPHDIVNVTREMNDKGESEYYLEGKKINRNRILDIFDMANAGLNQLNAVQQGTVTKISEMTNEEKRKTLEDLVGLSYFDEKKAETEKQLNQADQRLEVAMAKMGEVKKQIDELEIERNLKMRHEMIGHELDRFRAIEATGKLRKIRNEKSEKEEKQRTDLSEKEQLEKSQSVLNNEIEKIEKHPNADKLQICLVNTGKEKLSIICGANNINQGDFVPVATIGAKLDNSESFPEGIKIKKTKIRGIESSGKLCSLNELSVNDSSNGIFLLSNNLVHGIPISKIENLNISRFSKF